VPAMARQRADTLRAGGIVRVWVFSGSRTIVITSPAVMLPQARRLIGAIIAGLDSLRGAKERVRGWSEKTKITRRKE